MNFLKHFITSFLTLLLVIVFIFPTQAQTKKVLFQGFWWDYENSSYVDGWANYLTELAPRLREMGIDAVWIPPSVKNQEFGGFKGVGYAPYDHYDLGDKYQKVDVGTRLGTKDELLRMVAVLHANGIEVIQDIVPNHIIGAGSDTGSGGQDPTSTNDSYSNFRYTSYDTPATDQSESDYFNRAGRFSKNFQNFHANPSHNCDTGDICQAFFGPDICYLNGAYGQSSNATYNPVQPANYMRDGVRNWLIWSKKQIGFDGVRIDAVKHFDFPAAEDFLYNLQHNSGFASGGDAMLSVGEYVGGTSEVDSWYTAVQGRAGVFDFSLRAYDSNGGLYGMVYGSDNFDMRNLPGAQQTEANRIYSVGNIHRTVPFINNHDTFRPQLGATGNYTGWNTGDELSGHIEPNEPRLAAAYAVILAMDGNPQIFFEDMFDIGYSGNRYTHDPKSTTSLPAREDLINLIQCHQKLDFKSGVYKVRSAEVDVFVGQGDLSDHLIIERSGKALIGISDKYNVVQEVYCDTDFSQGTILMDYSGANGLLTYTVPADQRCRVLTQPVNFPTDSGNYHGYSVWAPVPGNTPFTSVAAMQAYLGTYTPPLNTETTQEWEMANDLGDSHCLSLMQGGALPANSTNTRTVGKIFVENATTIAYRVEPATNNVTVSFHSLDGTELHSANGSGVITGSFTSSYTGWITAKIRNTANNTPEQNALVRLTYTAPQTVVVNAFPTVLTKAIWTGNGGDSDVSDCRNWEEGKMPNSTTDVFVPVYANPKPNFTGTIQTKNIEIETGANFQIDGTLEVHGNFINNGTLSGCGTVKFAGSSLQNATGSTTFCILEVDNTANLNLAVANTVTQELRFTNGKFILNNGKLTLAGSATITGASTNNYVQTQNMANSASFLVQEVGATTVDFPVGNNTYTPVSLTNNGITRNFSVRTFDDVLENGTSGADYTNGNELNKSWEITPDGTGVDTNVSLQWNITEEGGTFNSSTALIYKNDGAMWNALTSGTVLGSNPYSITTTGVTSFSTFTVASQDNILPVDLLSFTASEIGKNAELTWLLGFELNNSSFLVEKSENGNDFKKIGTINSLGNSTVEVIYKFTDIQFNRTFFYRLIQVDLDGQESISETVKLEKTNGKLNLTISPNPFTNAISIRSNLTLDLNNQLDYSLSTIEGKQFLQGKTTILDIEARLNSFFKQSENGVYLLKIGEEEIFKLVKE
jgi:alpha-amylase